jgi:membrane protein DedA with SNARE-associated domain
VQLDIRLPIGLMFAVFGILLTGYGLVSNPQIYQRSLGDNINLEWGIVLIAFGAIMLWLGWRKRRTAGRP